MSLQIDDEIEVTSESAPYFKQRGFIEALDSGYRILPLVGVRFPNRSKVYWYSELEIRKVDADAPTEQIPVVG
jgi:hypothetical protein